MKKAVPLELKQKYKIPESLTDFQIKKYIHLIEWKWKNLTTKPVIYNEIEYGAILPQTYKDKFYSLFQPLVSELNKHYFKTHKHFGHMASSQAACLNLFLPILKEKSKCTITPAVAGYV